MEVPKIPGFELKQRIGTGRHGTVWVARGVDHRDMAVKVFDEGVDLSVLRHFHHRVGLEPVRNGAALVVHQELEKAPYHEVVELLADEQGLPLSLEEQRGNLLGDPELIWEFLDNFLKALAWMHRHPLAHGNLKPSNIFILPDGGVRLTDAMLSGISRDGICSDGLFYMPPEQLRDRRGFESGRAYAWDVYAFGVEAFYLLTGKFPRLTAAFDEALAIGEDHQLEIEADPNSIAGQLESAPAPAFPDTLPGASQRFELILDCLSLKPERRPANANELLARWETAVEPAGPPVESFKRQRQARRRWKRLTLSALVLTSVCAVLAILAWQREARRYDRLIYGEKMDKTGLRERLRDQAMSSEELITSANRQITAFERQADAARAARLRAEQRLRQSRELTWLMMYQAQGLEPGSSAFLSAPAKRAHLRQRLGEFLGSLPATAGYQDTRRQIRYLLAELDWQEGRWEEAASGLRDALGAPDLFGGVAVRRVLPERQLARALIELGDHVGAARALQRARKALTSGRGDSEWHADQLGRVEMLSARLAAIREDREAELRHTHAALNAFANAPAGPDSLVYFRGRYLELADRYADQLEARGSLESLEKLRRQASSVLRSALKEERDGALVYRLARTRLGLARSRLREGDLEAFKSELGELDKLTSELSKLLGFAEHAALVKADRSLLEAQDLIDLGKRSSVKGQLDIAAAQLAKVRQAGLRAQRTFLKVRLDWSRAWMLGGIPEVETIAKLAARLKALEAKADGVEARQLRAYRAQLLSDGASLLSATSTNEAVDYARQALDLWRDLSGDYPKNGDYRAMLQWTEETVNRLSPTD